MALVSIAELSDTDYSLRMDPEYFQPRWTSVRKRLPNKCQTLLDVASVKDGNHNAIADAYVNSGQRYLRGTDVNDFFISDGSPMFITQETYKHLGRGYVKPGDILVSIVGTIGFVSLVAAWREEMSANCKLAILRPHSMPSEVLASFFLTDTGQALLQMEVRGSVQQGIPLEGLEKMRIPPIHKRVWEPVRKLVEEASKIFKLGRDAYPDAEAELLQRMGWRELNNQARELCYVEDSRALSSAGRMDAEHFQPQYARLRQQLQRRGGEPLGKLWLTCDKGTQPEDYSDSGEIIVVKSKNVFGEGIDLEGCERAGKQAWEDEQARLKQGDLVINSTGRGTLGRAGVIPVCTSKVAASVDLLICRLNRQKIVPHYGSLFLNSPAGLAQSDQFQTGSSGQLHLYPQHIAQFLIFLPRTKTGQIDLAWQERLAAKLESAARAKTEAREKLEAAKRLVEEALA